MGIGVVRFGLCVMAIAFATTACVDLTAGQGGGNATADPTSDGGLEGGLTLQGAGCGTDGITGVTLCLAVNICPNDIIDSDLWPGCGFRLTPAGFDMQCICDDEVCPIGTPLTCDQIAPLLDAQSQIAVCASAAEGRCVKGTAAASSSSGTAATGTCDKACAQQCYGENGCLEQCGCAG
jgi:hypothetical protein